MREIREMTESLELSNGASVTRGIKEQPKTLDVIYGQPVPNSSCSIFPDGTSSVIFNSILPRCDNYQRLYHQGRHLWGGRGGGICPLIFEKKNFAILK